MSSRSALPLALVLAWTLLAPRTTYAQTDWPTTTLGVEVGIGYTGMSWEIDQTNEDHITRGSYLPALALGVALPIALNEQFRLQPHVGLHFDAVSLSNNDVRGYDDHYAFTSLRVGLMAVAYNGAYVVGFGPEYRVPAWIHSSLRSRGADGFEWVRFEEPVIQQDNWFFWTLRIGQQRQFGFLSADVTWAHRSEGLLGIVGFPENPLDYVNLRLNLHVPLYHPAP